MNWKQIASGRAEKRRRNGIGLLRAARRRQRNVCCAHAKEFLDHVQSNICLLKYSHASGKETIDEGAVFARAICVQGFEALEQDTHGKDFVEEFPQYRGYRCQDCIERKNLPLRPPFEYFAMLQHTSGTTRAPDDAPDRFFRSVSTLRQKEHLLRFGYVEQVSYSRRQIDRVSASSCQGCRSAHQCAAFILWRLFEQVSHARRQIERVSASSCRGCRSAHQCAAIHSSSATAKTKYGPDCDGRAATRGNSSRVGLLCEPL